MRWNTYIARKILASGGYGMLYNWFCTQQQASVEYGYLYNWYAATDSRNIAASGWHIATDAEWNALSTNLGGNSVSGGKLKEAGTIHWNSPNTGADNSSGFNARGAGQRLNNGSFLGTSLKGMTIFHSITTNVGYAYLSYNSAAYTLLSYDNSYKITGASIRMVKDDSTLAPYVGNDDKLYRTVKIGTQVWLADNLMETKYRDGSAIPEITDNTAWVALTTGARCSYNNVESNAGATKKLSSSDSFIVPSDSHISSLGVFAGGYYIAGGKIKEIGTTHWQTPNTGATNEFGFNAVGSGVRNESSGEFGGLNSINFILSSTTYYYDESLCIVGSLGYDYEIFNYEAVLNKKSGGSIRLCNPATLHANGYVGSYTQNDGTIIPTRVINNVEYTENLKETKWSDGTDIQNVTDNTAWSLLQSAACCDINNDPTNR